jgi:hypothetical protein
MAQSCDFKVCQNIHWSMEKLCQTAGTALHDHAECMTFKFMQASNWFLVVVIPQYQRGFYAYVSAISSMTHDSTNIMYAEPIRTERIGKGFLLPTSLTKSTGSRSVTVDTDFFRSVAAFYQ